MDAPRPKRGVKQPKGPPFPVPVGQVTFVGRFHGNSVIVGDPEHVSSLYSMGYFGKGSLSKSKPDYSKRTVISAQYQDVDTPTSDSSDGENNAGSASFCSHTDHRQESLVLMLVEAFFLSFGLGCLLVQRSDETIYNLEQLWQQMCLLDKTFSYNYVAYHHFRSKVLYKWGPPFYHASYSVLVRLVDEKSTASLSPCRELTWTSLSGLNRVTEQVAKKLLFCYVFQPEHIDLSNPNCTSKFQVQEMLIQRWVSSEERQDDHTKPNLKF